MTDYELRYKNVKHITLRIAADGTLQVTAPWRVSREEIERVLQQKAHWIAAHQQKAQQLQQQRHAQGLVNDYQDGGQVGYLGSMYPLKVQAQGKRSWQWDGTALLLRGCSMEAHCRQMVEQFYRQQMLQEIIPGLNASLREQLAVLELPEPAFTVRKMRASWGLCYSGQNRIVLNLWLAMAPLDCIRQVMLHEYLHFCQSNHSAEFYALLQQFEPQYRQLKHKLSVMVDLTALSE